MRALGSVITHKRHEEREKLHLIEICLVKGNLSFPLEIMEKMFARLFLVILSESQEMHFFFVCLTF